MAIGDQVSQGIFNPTPPDTNDPKFEYARPITQPKFLSTTATALETGKDVMTGAIKSADEIIQAFAKDDTRVAMENLRTDRSQEMDSIDAAVRGKVASLPPGQVGSATDLIGASTGVSSLPPELANFPKRLAALSGAKASGKISDTQYAATADSILSDIRARYPVEYRPIIDQTASSILGWDPANHKITSQINDINSFLTTKQEGLKEVHAQFRRLSDAGDPGAAKAMERFDQTGDVYAAQTWIASRNTDKWFLEHQKIAMDAKELDLKSKGLMAERYATDNLTISSAQWFDDLEAELKAKGVRKGENGNYELATNDTDMIGQAILNKKNDFKAFARQFLDTADMGGESFTRLKGPKAREDLIESLSARFTDSADRVYNGNSGMLGLGPRLEKGIVTDATLRALKHPELGSPLTNLKVIETLGGPQAAAAYFSAAQLPVLLQKPFNLQQSEYAAQRWDTPYPLRDVIDRARNAGIESPKYYDELINTFYGPTGLLNEKTPDAAKIPFAIGLASEKNRGFLSRINPEYTDADGVHHSGQMDAWRKVTSPAVAEKMAQLSARSGDWRLFDGYKDNMVSEFKAGLFAPDLKRLAEVSQWAKLEWHQPDGKNGVYEWRFQEPAREIEGARSLRRAGYRGELDPTRAEAEKVLARVNNSVRGLVNIARAAQIDPSTTILNVFKDIGFNISGDNIRGIPDAMVQSVKAAQKQKADQAAKFKELQ